MADLNLTSFNPLYPMRVHQYDELFNDQNQGVPDKINSIIDYLNKVGKLTNDVVKDWNTVYQWVMNDGLTTDVNNKLEAMLANHEFDSIIDALATKVGDLNTLTTTAKDTIVNAINSLQTAVTANTSNISTNTANIATNTANIASNTSALAQIVTQVVNVKNPPASLTACKGDGVTDDSSALRAIFNYALTQYANGVTVTIYVPAGNYVVNSSIVVDGNQNVNTTTSRFHLKMEGFFTSPNGVGKTLSFKNLTGCDFDIKIKGLNHSTSNLVYSTQLSANVTGLDVALYLESCTYTNLNFFGKRFFGRGIEANNCSTNTWGSIRGDMVGQMLYIVGTMGFGTIGNVWVTEYMGSYFKAVDVTVSYYENMILNTSVKKGIMFDTCSSIWIDVMNVGNNSDAYEVNISSCYNVNICSLYIFGNNTSGTDYCQGLYIFQSYNLNIVVNTSYIYGNALYVNGLKASYIKVIDSFSQNIGMVTTNSSYGVSQSTIEVFSRYRTGTGLIIQKGSSGQGIDLNVGINAKDRNAGNSNTTDLQVMDSDSMITLLPQTHANTVDIPASNTVRDIFSATSTFTNVPQSQIKPSYPNPVTATIATSLSGYALNAGLDNNVVRQNKAVTGTISLSNGAQTGNIAQNDILAQFDVSLAPTLPVFIPIVVLLSTGAYQTAYASIEYDGGNSRTILKAQSVVNSGNVKWVIANFAYYTNR